MPRRDDLREQLLPQARRLVEFALDDELIVASIIAPVPFDERTLEARLTRVRGENGVWITCVGRRPWHLPERKVAPAAQLDLLGLFAGGQS